jgi:hypothetical protein
VSKWVGLLKVTGRAYDDQSRIEDELFPVRLPVEVVVALTRQTGVPIKDMEDQLSIFENPAGWTGKLRQSLTKWTEPDGVAITTALEKAQADLVEQSL